jgi:hypothetical protein
MRKAILPQTEAGAMYGGVYSFLSLGEAKSSAKFPIQADFLVQPGRDALNYEAKWNHWILDEVRKLSLEANKKGGQVNGGSPSRADPSRALLRIVTLESR